MALLVVIFVVVVGVVVEPDKTNKIILTGASGKSRTLHKEELGMSETEKGIRRKIQDNARLAQSQSKKRTKYSQGTPTTQKPLPHRTTPPAKTTHPPKSNIVKPSQKRVRVSTSDGRTCNLCLDIDVTYAQLQEAIERELK